MKRFVAGTDRGQSTLFPECLEDWICEDNPVRVIDVFVDELDLAGLIERLTVSSWTRQAQEMMKTLIPSNCRD